MNIQLLEDRLRRNPLSPLFARLAASYLEEGDAERGLALCIKGIEQHPDYPTGHLVLGKCYEALNRNVEAILEYRRALKAVPDNPAIRSLLENVEEREKKAFQAFAEEQVRKLRQKSVSRSAAPLDLEGDEEEEEQPDSASDRGKIVTATLAEIYASQEEYEEAIRVYRRLVKEGEGDKRGMRERIKELERMAKARTAETRDT